MSNPIHIEVFAYGKRRQFGYRFRRGGNILTSARGYNRRSGAKRAAVKFVAALATMKRGWETRIKNL